MAELSFQHLLQHIQSQESIPQEMLSSNDGLHFGDIHFALLWHSLDMQQVSLTYLKSLIGVNAFQSIGYKDDMYSNSMAILIVFLSDEQLEEVKHVHIGLVVHCMASSLAAQAGIFPFVKSIEDDLAKARERWDHRKDIGGMHSYSLLIANSRGMMALPTEPPYCLVYPTVYDDQVVDKTHFNTKSSPSGMHTEVCMCHSLLHFTDKDPANRRKFEGSHLTFPHGAQYDHLFPEITTVCNHQGPLIDPNTGEPYPVVAVGDFCLMDSFFPGCPGDSFVFQESELTKVQKKGYCISTYREEPPSPPAPREGHTSPPAKQRGPTRLAARLQEHLHLEPLTPQAPTSPPTRHSDSG